MKIFIIRTLIKLLKYFSNGKVEIRYHSRAEITRKEKNEEAFRIICDIFEEYYEIPFKKLIEITRIRPICEKRQLLHFLAYKYTGLSTIEIGKRTNKDHATVLHSFKVIYNLLETDRHMLSQHNDLCKEIEINLINN